MQGITKTISENLKKYETAPELMLSKATDYGDIVHEAISYLLENNEIPNNIKKVSYERLALSEIQQFLEYNNLKVIESEKQHIWTTEFKQFTCKADLFCTLNDRLTIIDFKTTKNKDIEAAQQQLSAYAYTLEEEKNITIDDLYIYHLPKAGTFELIKIEKLDREELINKLSNNTPILYETPEDYLTYECYGSSCEPCLINGKLVW